MTTVFQESQSFFGPITTPKSSLLPLQMDPRTPSATGLNTGTGLLLPDRILDWRMRHFASDLYDLRDTSHLVRLMQALLGDSGGGQLRRRNNLAAFQTALHSTRFYDLDTFYGAIFGLSRIANEVLWINPMKDVATGQEWEDIETRDGNFRARIEQLASAINLGATVPGMLQAASAITQVDCDLYQTWALSDTYGLGAPGRTWADVETAFSTWDLLEASGSYDQIENVTIVGRSGANTRSEVIVRPIKDYDLLAAEDGVYEAARQKAEDVNGLLRVLSVLKPASVLLTVDSRGVAIHQSAHIGSMEADSNYWEIISKVSPRRDRTPLPKIEPYPLSVQQQAAGVDYYAEREVPGPPDASTQAMSLSYNSHVISISAYTFDDPDTTIPGNGPMIENATQDVVTYLDGTVERFSAGRGLLDSRLALAAQYAAEGSIVAHSYSGDRKAVLPHA